MKTFVAITFTDNTYDVLDSCVNSLLMSPVRKEIHVFDATKDGVENDVKSFFRSYSKFKVFLHRVKPARNLPDDNSRKNAAILASIHQFKAKSGFSTFIHVNPNLFFKGHGLQILSDQAEVYSCVSPIVENKLGIEIMDGVADRFGFNVYTQGLESLSFATGQIEESFAINHKCFALSKRYVDRIGKLWQSLVPPNDYVNAILIEYGNIMPKVDTNSFIHENLY